jgi:hypothetical protein
MILRLLFDSLTEPVNAWEQDHQLRRRNRGAVVKRQERPLVNEISKKGVCKKNTSSHVMPPMRIELIFMDTPQLCYSHMLNMRPLF